jgi:hypothetical protein
MKRLFGLAVLFVILCMCVPSSYGQPSDYFLIYNVSFTVSGANNELAVSIPLKGYLVANIDDSDGSIVDANLIMYGKDKLDNNMKTYVQLNNSASDSTYVHARIYYNGNFAGFDVWSYDHAPFYFELFAVGKMVSKDIGLGSTRSVASSLKGPISVWGDMLLDANDGILGTGNVSASLDLKTTKLVNANGWTQENIIETGGTIAGKHQNSLIEILTAQHYSPAILP